MPESETPSMPNAEVAEKLVEEYLSGNITSLVDLSEMLNNKAGISISKSTLARRLKGKVNVRTGRRRKAYFNRKSSGDELDDREAYAYSYSLSRNLNETIVTVPVDSEYVRQYALVRVAGNGGKKYYRCNQCLKFRRSEKNTAQAYLIMENGRIVGNKHHNHHPLCYPTKRVEATTTSLDRENRKDIRFGLKTPKMAYAEGFFKAIDLASADNTSRSDCLPKVYPQWSRVRKSYFRQNRLGRLDRVKSLSSEVGIQDADANEIDDSAVYGTYGDYIVFEGEEIPEGYEEIPIEELENQEGEMDEVWAAQQAKYDEKVVIEGGLKEESGTQNSASLEEASAKSKETSVKDEDGVLTNHSSSSSEKEQSTRLQLRSKQRLSEEDLPPYKRSRVIPQNIDLNSHAVDANEYETVCVDAESEDTSFELKIKEERKRLSKSLVQEITASPNFKRQPPRMPKKPVFESDKEISQQRCYLPCNSDGDVLVFSSDLIHVIEKVDGEFELGYEPNIDLAAIIRSLKPYGVLPPDEIVS